MVAEIKERSYLTAVGGEGRSLSLVPPSLETERIRFRPFQIVSLYDMLGFWAYPFYEMTYRLHSYLEGELYGAIQRRGAQDYLNDKDRDRAREMLDRVKFLCEPFEMEQTIRRYYSAHQVTYYHTTSLEKLRWEIQEIESAIRSDLNGITLVFLPEKHAEYLSLRRRPNEGGLFGVDVSKRFPKADAEVSLAGDCYAIEAYTACVFHLMRAVEIGARVMIGRRALNAERYLPQPLELCDWHGLLQALDKGVDGLRQGSRSDPRKKKKLEFYSHAVGLFRNFKDAWRNKVSHVRHVYKRGETEDALDITRQFFQHLASKLKE